eukprot:ANDGO_02223.mRNA.1 hypothetical protein
MDSRRRLMELHDERVLLYRNWNDAFRSLVAECVQEATEPSESATRTQADTRTDTRSETEEAMLMSEAKSESEILLRVLESLQIDPSTSTSSDQGSEPVDSARNKQKLESLMNGFPSLLRSVTASLNSISIDIRSIAANNSNTDPELCEWIEQLQQAELEHLQTTIQMMQQRLAVALRLRRKQLVDRERKCNCHDPEHAHDVDGHSVFSDEAVDQENRENRQWEAAQQAYVACLDRLAELSEDMRSSLLHLE